MNIRFTLVADGLFDSALIPILTWLLRADGRVVEIESQYANPSALPKLRQGLSARVAAALAYFPADILFVHRDSEREEYSFRREEITAAMGELADAGVFIPVIPVRMTEAWLLFDEAAIRRAAGNPNGRLPLNLPRLQDIELLPEPKSLLREALLTASERRGRARNKFNVGEAAARVVELIDDFSSLSVLHAFQRLQADIGPALDKIERRQSRPVR